MGKREQLKDSSVSHLMGEVYTQKPYVQISEFVQSLVDSNASVTVSEVNYSGEFIQHDYQSIYLRSLQVFTYLVDVGVHKGDRVILLYDTAHEFIAAMWACLLGGFVAVPWSFQGVEMDREAFLSSFEQLVKCLGRTTVLYSSASEVRLEAAEIKGENRRLLDTSKFPDYSKIASIAKTEPDEIGFFIGTSGTTGTPKLAMVSYRVMINRVLGATSAKKKKNYRSLSLVPFNSISAQALVFPSSNEVYYYNGHYLSIKPIEFIQFLEKLKIQHIAMTSHLAHIISRVLVLHQERIDLSALRVLGFGSDYIVPQRVNQLLHALQMSGVEQLRLAFAYGMTEVGLVAASDKHIDLAHGAFEIDNSLLDMFFPAIEVKIVEQNNELLPQGSIGEIQIRSREKMFAGFYQQNMDGLFVGDDWYCTRDLGVIENGCLDITGRTASLLKNIDGMITCEQLENSLHGVVGVQDNLVFVSELKEKAELLLFFVAEDRSAKTLNSIRLEMLSRVTDYKGRLRLIPINVDQIPTTRTSKIHRNGLKQMYLEQRLNLNAGVATATEANHEDSNKNISKAILQTVTQVWMRELELKGAPGLGQNLFEAGGDSLDFVIILSEMESKFSIQLKAEEFYKKPLLSHLCQMIEEQTTSRGLSATNKRTQPELLLGKISNFMLSWKGKRLHEDSLIVGQNTAGYKSPIFWIFQEAYEFNNLAKSLGKDQPLYGVRSLVRTEYSNYPSDMVDILADKYLKEILEVKGKSSLTIGANCQGGVIAISIARKLQKVGAALNKLVLLEWGHNTEIYEGKTLLLYGEKSHVAEVYCGKNERQVNWRLAFPLHEVAVLPCGHSQYFRKENVEFLSKALTKV